MTEYYNENKQKTKIKKLREITIIWKQVRAFIQYTAVSFSLSGIGYKQAYAQHGFYALIPWFDWIQNFHCYTFIPYPGTL